MFSAISNVNIKTINFTNVNVGSISEKVFSSLRSLRVLDFTNNPQARDSLVSVSLTLNQTSIEELYLENTSLGKYLTINHVLENLNGTNIKILSLDRNNIHFLDFSLIIFGLPLLETFTVTHNSILNFIFMFENFINATHLKKADISYQTILLDSTSQNLPALQRIEPFPRVRKKFPEFCNYSHACIMTWPNKVEWLAASHVAGFIIPEAPKVVFLGNGSLKYGDASGNHFETFPEPVLCPNKSHKLLTVDHVDISNCGIKCVVKDIFEHCEYHVQFLNLSHNKLGLLKGGCNREPMDTCLSIKPLTTLEILDLSYNSISKLFNDTFDTLINLKKLFLSNNKLSSWKPNLIKSVQLEYLDLSYNHFQTFPLDTRLMLHELDKDHWKNTSKHLTLNLDGNKFSCTCKNIQYLKWLAISK